MAIDSEFSYGYVVGQLVLAKSDGDDLNRLPDFLGQNAKVTFTRTQGQYVQPVKSVRSGIRALMVSHQPVIAGLMSDGTITGDVDSNAELKPDAKPGLWLVIGQYNVDFGGAFPSTTIEVKDSHTEDSPLDIASTIGYKPAPNHVVTTVELPTGGEPGQVYGWSGSSVGWYTPEPGPSAYEVALRNGFSGTVDAWLLSLKGGKGDPGLSAYEVARSRGFSGTVDEWLASLKGLKGDPGFSAYQLAKTNGFTGTVTEWLDSLVGRKGDPGPPGSPTEYIKVGPGRPDVPSSTAGTITGNEPVGATYYSEDGAKVGAYVWMRRPGGKWEVTNGDTGWRNVTSFVVDSAGTAAVSGGILRMRRLNDVIYASTFGQRLSIVAGLTGVRVNHPAGFEPVDGGSPWIWGAWDRTAFYALFSRNSDWWPNSGPMNPFGSNSLPLTSHSWLARTSSWPTFPLPGSPD